MTDNSDKFEKTIESLRSLRWDSQRRKEKIEVIIQKLPAKSRKITPSHRQRLITFAVVFFLLIGASYATGGWKLVRDHFFRVTLQSPDGKKIDVELHLIEGGRFESSEPDGSKKIFEKVDPSLPDKNKHL